MSTAKGDRLLEVAAAISDQDPVEWSMAETEEVPLLDSLRRIETVASALTELRAAHGAGSGTEPEAGEELFRWGHLRVMDKLGDITGGQVCSAIGARRRFGIDSPVIRIDQVDFPVHVCGLVMANHAVQ